MAVESIPHLTTADSDGLKCVLLNSTPQQTIKPSRSIEHECLYPADMATILPLLLISC